MKALILLLTIYQTIATLFELPGGWIMFTRVDAPQWRISHQGEEVDWHKFVSSHHYLVNDRQVKKLAIFICRKKQFNSIDLATKTHNENDWHEEHLECK